MFSLKTSLTSGNFPSERVISILDEIPMIDKVTNGDEAQFNSMDKIHVDFAYDKALILKDMNLNIQENEVIGIQGKSGSGKSTLLKLLMRFWDVSDGNNLVDGIDIKNLNTSNLRKMKAM